MFQVAEQAGSEPGHAASVGFIDLVMGSSGVVLFVLVVLVLAALMVPFVWILKMLQLGSLQRSLNKFEKATETTESASELISEALAHKNSPGGRVVLEMGKRHHHQNLSPELLVAVGKRAIVGEQKRASSLMPLLSSIASASPFIGLFGTVWGIMNAFIKIGVEKSASLPVVAPAIGEALIATAVGLVAAIPATVAYNFVDKRIGDVLEELETSTEAWAQTIAADPGGPESAVPLVRESNRPPGGGGGGQERIPAAPATPHFPGGG